MFSVERIGRLVSRNAAEREEIDSAGNKCAACRLKVIFSGLRGPQVNMEVGYVRSLKEPLAEPSRHSPCRGVELRGNHLADGSSPSTSVRRGRYPLPGRLGLLCPGALLWVLLRLSVLWIPCLRISRWCFHRRNLWPASSPPLVMLTRSRSSRGGPSSPGRSPPSGRRARTAQRAA